MVAAINGLVPTKHYAPFTIPSVFRHKNCSTHASCNRGGWVQIFAICSWHPSDTALHVAITCSRGGWVQICAAAGTPLTSCIVLKTAIRPVQTSVHNKMELVRRASKQARGQGKYLLGGIDCQIGEVESQGGRIRGSKPCKTLWGRSKKF